MKMAHLLLNPLALVVFILASTTAFAQLSPELFWVSDEYNNRDLTLSPDGSTLLTTTYLPRNIRGTILLSRFENGAWSEREIAPFSGQYSDIEPVFSADGRRVWFASTRPRPGREGDDWDLWFVDVDMATGAFGEPVNAGDPINSTGNEYYPSVSARGVVYFTSDREGGIGTEDIYRHDPAISAGVENLGASVNSANYEFNAFIAPDESYLLFTAYGREDDLGRGDLYISRNDGTGTFSAARHLGNGINSDQLDYCPFVHGDSLYFTSERGQTAGTFSSITQLREYLSHPGNGLGDVYRIGADSLP